MATKKKKRKDFTITEAAAELGVSRQAVHRAITRKVLHAKWETIPVLQKVLVISAESLQKYQVSLRHQAAGKKID